MSAMSPYLRVGLFLGVAEVAYGLFFRLAGFHHTSPWAWVFYLMLPVATWIAQQQDAARRDLSWFGAVRTGSAAVLIGAALYCAKVWLYNRFVSDSLLVDVRADQLARAEASGLGGDELASRMESLDALLSPAVFSLSVWVQLALAGVGCAALTGLIARRRSGASV